MSSVLHFSPAFKPSLSLSSLTSSPYQSSKKRRRDLESFVDSGGHGGGEGSEADSAANGTSLPSELSNDFVTTPLAASFVEPSHGDEAFHSQTSNQNVHEGPNANDILQSFAHHTTETAPSVFRGRISDELARLKPPLYVATGRLPCAMSEKTSGGMGLRQYHLNTITAVLHRCLSECDHIRAGRAWAMLLRVEQHGQSIDLRTHDRWGVGAELLIQRESQMTQETQDHRAHETSNPTSNFRVKSESIEKAKEYYDRLVLQYPYRKAFPSATGARNFSIAMFALWIYAVKERNLIALMAVSSSNESIDETVAEANDNTQRSPASHTQPDHYRKLEEVKRDTLQGAQEIANRLDELLANPPYSDNAKLSKLYSEVALWIADLSIAPISPQITAPVFAEVIKT